MKKRLTAFILALALLWVCFCAQAEGMPEWEYPLEPEILYDFNMYITLANRQNLLDSDYIPADLVNTTCKKAHDAGTPELRQAASDAINAMFAAAQEDGLTLYLKSA